MRRKIIGIIGSGVNPWTEYTRPLARWIAKQDYHLLTGAGQGVMKSASEAFAKVENRNGVCLGIVPTIPDLESGFVAKKHYPNQWVEIPMLSPLPTFDGSDVNQISRNYIIVLSSDLLVALPGNIGTRNEINLAIRFQKPLILFAPESEMLDLPQDLSRTSALEEVEEFIEQNCPSNDS